MQEKKQALNKGDMGKGRKGLPDRDRWNKSAKSPVKGRVFTSKAGQRGVGAFV